MEILLAILIELYLWEDTNGYGLKDKSTAEYYASKTRWDNYTGD